MSWNYISEIEDDNIFSSIAKDYEICVPEEFVDFIKKYNAGTPEKYHIKINGVERVVGGMLSFNRNEEDVDSAFLALDILKNKCLLPFAVDPFGNYFCYKNGKVLFWNHEQDTFDETKMTLNDFIESLY